MNTVNNTNSVDLSQAPGGDLNLDDIFGDEPNPNQQPTTTVNNAPQATTTEPEPFLKTSTGTVYKTAEDAAKGVEHKDQLIAQLRQQLSETTGADPLKKGPTTTSAPRNYLDDKDGYFRDLSKAVEDRNPEKYMEVQSKFVLDTLAPLGPAITNLVRTSALDALEKEIPDIRKFANSDDYAKTLESYPLLKGAIQMAENNPAASNQLPEFYKMVYNVNRGTKLPEIVEQARTAATPQTTRPTVTSTVPSAPSGSSPSANPSLDSKDGRRAIIEQQERSGVLNLRF